MGLLASIRFKETRFFLATAGVLATMATMAYLSYSESWQNGIGDLQQRADSELDISSTQLFTRGDKYSYLPEVVSQYAVIAAALAHPKDGLRAHQANLLLADINKKAGSNLLYIMALDGTTVASSNWQEKDSLVGNNYGFRPYFMEAVDKGHGYFYAMGVTTHVPGYYVSYLVKRNNTAIGVAVVKIDIGEPTLRWRKNEYEFAVTDKSGVIFLTSRADWKYRPMWKLAESERMRLMRTRQYEGVLKEALPIRLKENFRQGEQLISLAKGAYWYGEEDVNYFVKSRTLSNGEWTLHILIPTHKIDKAARQAATMAAGAVSMLAFLAISLNQIRVRARERKESQFALGYAYDELERAHGTLEQRNRELQALNEELRITSTTDPLTGIFNRRFFLESASKLVNSASRHNFPLSIILIDVDHFKEINDRNGHPVGDKVLQTLAGLYQEEMREADILARYGGEEFAIALPHTDAEAARVVAERIRIKVMRHQTQIVGGMLFATISGGISQYLPNETSIEDTIKRADDALYQAKNSGRNRVVVNDARHPAV